VRLLGWSKIVLDAQMNLDDAGLKPHAPAHGERRWLGHFGEAEDADVKLSASVFGAARDGQLYVLAEGGNRTIEGPMRQS